MTLTSKQRQFLRSKAHHLDTVFNIGKNGIDTTLIDGLNDVLENRELIKINVLKNCDLFPGEAATEIAQKTRSEIVQVMGRKITLYRKSHKEKVEHVLTV